MHVRGDALVVSGAVAERGTGEGAVLRQLGDDVDRAARRAASAERRIRSAHDLLRIDREHLAGLRREIAHPIELARALAEIGRAPCRDSVCEYVSLSVVAASLHKK